MPESFWHLFYSTVNSFTELIRFVSRKSNSLTILQRRTSPGRTRRLDKHA